MNSLGNNDVAFNLALFNKLRFYHIFEPNGTKIFNYNAYKIACVISIVYILSVNIWGLLGIMYTSGDEMDEIGFMQLLYSHLHCLQTSFKIAVCIYKADEIWDVLDVTRVNFMNSARCSKHIRILHEGRDTSIKITNFLYGFITLTIFVWFAFPLFVNVTTANGVINGRRYENILNFRFPVTTQSYNRHYVWFYAAEVIVTIYLGYSILNIDILLISLVYVFIAQYEMHARAFEDVGHDQDIRQGSQKGYYKCYEDFKSIIFDQQKVHLKLKSFYSIVWLMTLVTVTTSSVSIVTLSYTFIVIFKAAGESLTILNVLKLTSAFLYLTIELFLYCYLLDNINDKKESVTFGMYSCNWTTADLKFQKSLLLAMRMNDANNLTIKITPTRSINLNLFSNVIMTCYNVVSVLLRTRNTNKRVSD